MMPFDRDKWRTQIKDMIREDLAETSLSETTENTVVAVAAKWYEKAYAEKQAAWSIDCPQCANNLDQSLVDYHKGYDEGYFEGLEKGRDDGFKQGYTVRSHEV